MLVMLYVVLPLTLLFFSSVISYVLLLLFMVISVLGFVSYHYPFSTLLGLVILTVYIGAIITLFVYVSAVSPNDYIQLGTHTWVVVSVVILFLTASFISVTVFNSLYGFKLHPVSVEIFTGSGIYLTGFLTLVMLIILLVSTYSTPSLSMFRSLN